MLISTIQFPISMFGHLAERLSVPNILQNSYNSNFHLQCINMQFKLSMDQTALRSWFSTNQSSKNWDTSVHGWV